MDFKDAIWEKRNLGIHCTEVTVDAEDTPRTLRDGLLDRPGEYILVRLPIARLDLSSVLTELGYTFVETMFRLEKSLDDSALQPPNQDAAQMSLLLNGSDSKERIFQAIKKGMFATDRISLDPAFSPEQAAIRYCGFLTDELAQGAQLLEFFYQGTPFGFSCLRALDPEHYYQALTGLYESMRGKGLGFALNYLPSRFAFGQGGKSIVTGVSSNNTVSLRIHLKCGFLPTQTTYIFVRHNPPPLS